MTQPQRRVIVLGASNVARSLYQVVTTACHAWGGPLDLLAAIGHGRSFGTHSSVLGRTLPSILQCDLWDEWRSREPLPTAALITDIGNDILFGATPDQIVGWVRQCLERLVPHCQRVVVTELPLASLGTLSRGRFLFFRTVLFPRSRIQWPEGKELAVELNSRVVELCQEFGVSMIRPSLEWYGLDPIHIRRRHGKVAWRQILDTWQADTALENTPANDAVVEGLADAAAAQWRAELRAWLWRPKWRVVLGVTQTCVQPSAFLPDGTAVSLY